MLRVLEQEGFSQSKLGQIHAPIGLPINAISPKEIAVSILAELVQCRRENFPRHKRSDQLSVEDIDIPLLECLASEDTAKALLIVCETHGSTPARSGTMMAVTRDFQTVGTIGGGRSEHLVLMEAYRLIGSGERKSILIDMSGDIEENDGMACGGR